MTPSTLHQQARRLAAQLEQTLDDPVADAGNFLGVVDRYAEVLDALRPTPPGMVVPGASSQAAAAARPASAEAGLLLAFVVTCVLIFSVLYVL